MATMYRYQLPVNETGWTLQGQTQTSFTWEYEDERAFGDMGAIEFADVDTDALLAKDEEVAREFDAGRYVQQTIA